MPSWIGVWAETDGAGTIGWAIPVMEVFDRGEDNPPRGDAGALRFRPAPLWASRTVHLPRAGLLVRTLIRTEVAFFDRICTLVTRRCPK